MKLSRRGAAMALLVLGGVFVARLIPDGGALLRDADEAHFCAAAARLAAHGGPLYGNALVTKGPVIYWLLAPVFRLAGVYNMVAVRVAMAAWWLATAWAVYLAARALTGRAAAVVAAGAFLLAALNPGFRSARADALVPLPMAVAVALCLRCGGRRGVLVSVLGGVAAGLAFLTKQQAGMMLPALAGFPLLTWWWRRGASGQARAEEAAASPRLGVALCQSALIVVGFVLAVGGVWLWYALRGAGHEFLYCVWSYNWMFLEHTPSGGLLPSASFFLGRAARYLSMEPLLGMAVVGAAAGLAWRGARASGTAGAPWRAQVAGLVLVFGVTWMAATPGDIPATAIFAYVAYVSQLYVPMALLSGVAVEVALDGAERRGVLIAALVALAAVFIVVPTSGPTNLPLMRLRLDWTTFPAWHLPASVAAFTVAAWLLGGRRVVPFAPCIWLLVYVSARWGLGWVGTQPAATAGLVGLGLLWQAVKRRWLWLAAVAGIAHMAGCRLDWLPMPGLALGAAVWVASHRELKGRERWALAAVYLLPALCLEAPLTFSHLRTLSGPAVYWRQLSSARELMAATMPDARLLVALAVVAVAARVGSRGRWSAARRSALGLLAYGGLGAFLAAVILCPTGRLLSPALTVTAMAAAFGLIALFRPAADESPRRASYALGGGAVAAGLAALALGLLSPVELTVRSELEPMVSAIGSTRSLYVWGLVFDTELYIRSGSPPALPQVCPWVVARVQPTPPRPGLFGHPRLATLAGVDECLARRPPQVLYASDLLPDPAGFPRFGPILAHRYRLAARGERGRVYQLRGPLDEGNGR